LSGLVWVRASRELDHAVAVRENADARSSISESFERTVGDSEKGSARIPCAVLIPSLDGNVSTLSEVMRRRNPDGAMEAGSPRQFG
jgi:hypothetical protein